VSAWIQSHQSLRDHPKTRRLARRDGVGGIRGAVGLLHCLWWWCLDYASDGDLSRYDAEDIAIACEWAGDPDTLVSMLVETGFLDDNVCLQVHDWADYGGKWKEKRSANARRQQEMRAAYADGTIEAVRERDGDTCRYCGKTVSWTDKRGPDGATYDHVDPNGPTTPENLVVACRSCNSAKGPRSPSEAGMSLIQVGIKSDLSCRKRESSHRFARREEKEEKEEKELNPLASASALTDEEKVDRINYACSPISVRLVDADLLPDSDTTNDFAEWWSAYGKVGSKADALTLYRYWRQHGATADDLLMAAVAYRQHCEATACKLQHARTFLARKPCRWREWADGEEHGSMDVVGDARLQDVIAAGMEWMEGSDGGLAPGAVVAIEAGRGDTHTAGGEDARRSLPAGSVAGAERRGLHDGPA